MKKILILAGVIIFVISVGNIALADDKDDLSSGPGITLRGPGRLQPKIQKASPTPIVKETAPISEPREPLVEYKDGQIASITTFGKDGKPTDKYIFDASGKITAQVHYGKDVGSANPTEPRAPIISYRDGKILSMVIFGNDGKTADICFFDRDGKITKSTQYKGGSALPKSRTPIIEYVDGKIASLTTFGKDGKPTDKYIFDAEGKITAQEHYGKDSDPSNPTMPRAPIISYRDGNILSMVIFGNDGKTADICFFDRDGKIVHATHYVIATEMPRELRESIRPDAELTQRKAVETKVQTQANDKRFVGEMANKPNKEGLPLQKKR